MSATSRRKGATAERELAALLRDELGIPIERQLGQERDGGADLHVGRARIQVKRCERLAIPQWWEQTVRDAGEQVPVLAYRQSRRPWTFRMRFRDVMTLSGPLGEWLDGMCELEFPAFVYVAREVLL